MSKTGKAGWIGVDLDGTLAHYDGWKGVNHIGEPIPPMVDRVRRWLARGETVKIFTARVHGHRAFQLDGTYIDAITPIEAWCEKHLGQKLEVTNVKDFGMIELWDDRAVQVTPNTGCPLDGKEDGRSARAVLLEFIRRVEEEERTAPEPDDYYGNESFYAHKILAEAFRKLSTDLKEAK